MRLKVNSGLLIYVKSYITMIVLYTVAKVIIRIISIIFNRNLSTDIGVDFSIIVLASIILSLFTLPNYLYTTKTMRMDDKALFTEKITSVLCKMKWKIERQEEAELIFVSQQFLLPTWKERITIRFTETDIQIAGPREYIERAIKMSSFPYGAFEIDNID